LFVCLFVWFICLFVCLFVRSCIIVKGVSKTQDPSKAMHQ
jgi:hypothetical protein